MFVLIFTLSLVIVIVTTIVVRLRIPDCPQCPDPNDFPTFNCSNCTIPEPECDQCPADLSKCRAAFPPDCTQCPTDCIKANTDPSCAPNCFKCAVSCPISIPKCRDILDNLYYKGDANLSNVYSRLNVLVNNLVQGRFGFSIRFKPMSNSGLLCTFVDQTLFVMYLLGGRVGLYIQSSSSEIYNDYPIQNVLPLNQISTVSFTTSPKSRNAIITVNATQRTINIPPVTLLTKMYIGGVPTTILSTLPTYLRTGFRGCIFEIKSAVDTPLDLTKVTRNNVDLGCQ